ncbi:putative ABC transporter ATP-binding protein YjjK [Sedimentisphaera cyanobacteriorum]|uniref:Putative ABC transporter ATP-binding protein YjjK n=1 Tax=Sedimentisphaera cyanobacteriorum TaxID=1940790 RepID=A0A1Q2HSR5_9BACT|nr:ABC-F family ATP-binding cassette domain-containing protein [Sedimentisphaera cyanobacteriorum]AQQ10410.1 putative ABC transporter ATP-binding protein YjjK [Sedimentisphaera cyanobacteriorum]
MPLLQLKNIEKSFGTNKLFSGLDMKIYRKEKIGLIGNNGTGKTTLFKMILGKETPDGGEILSRKDYSIGYLPQEPFFEKEKTVIDIMQENLSHIYELEEQVEQAASELETKSGQSLEKAMARYEQLSLKFELAGGYDIDTRIKMILSGVGLGEELYGNKVCQLSGGQLSRLGLASVLITGSDLLLLDEPTNHLDLAATEWLENFLKNYPGAALIISHDRFLLDKVAVKIAELENMKATLWKGNYSQFLESKENDRIRREREQEKRQKMVDKEMDFIARNRNDVGMRRVARGRAKRLERLLEENPDFLETQQKIRTLSFSFEDIKNFSHNVLKCRSLSKAYGELKLFSELNFDLTLGQSLAVTGPNGTGKSTLLKIALGKIAQDTGKIKFGNNLNVGYLDQQGEELLPESSVIDEILRLRKDLKPEQARNVLGAFLFFGDEVFKRVENLSGGERNRLMLCRLVLERPDVLVLDEPTNHLDIASKEALETALQEFEGTVIFVSHDRYFIDKICDLLMVIGVDECGRKQMGRHEFFGPGEKLYTEYYNTAARRAQDALKKKYSEESTKSQTPVRKNKRHKERKTAPEELKPFNKYRPEDIEDFIMEKESLIEELKDKFGLEEYYKDHKKMGELQEQVNIAESELELLYKAYEWKLG